MKQNAINSALGALKLVPMYLNQGETVRVDTRDGKFVARV